MSGPTAPALIEVRELSKAFGKRVALDRVSLEVPAGEIFGLLGHNGAGKSTLIGMLLGQVWPSAGDVRVCGCDVTRDRGGALARVGAIFESPVFYDYLSGWRNLEILSSYSAVTPAARLREVIDWVGLTGRETSLVRTYSHGMRARLALAQALLPQPVLLILDEPGDGLDPEGTAELRGTLLRLQRELGLTLLLSSHLLSEVEQMCTRIAVLCQGRKVFDGPLSETRRPGGWVRLRTDDFPVAVEGLLARGLVVEASLGRRLRLAEGVGADQIVRHLVGAGRSVHEIAPETDSLEDFYLRLMGERPGPEAG